MKILLAADSSKLSDAAAQKKSDIDFDELFTKDKPGIFAFHAYPWLIHRLT